MSTYDKNHQVRSQEGMRIKAEQNVRYKHNIFMGEPLPYAKVESEYGRLLKNKINKDKCKTSRRHI